MQNPENRGVHMNVIAIAMEGYKQQYENVMHNYIDFGAQATQATQLAIQAADNIPSRQSCKVAHRRITNTQVALNPMAQQLQANNAEMLKWEFAYRNPEIYRRRKPQSHQQLLLYSTRGKLLQWVQRQDLRECLEDPSHQLEGNNSLRVKFKKPSSIQFFLLLRSWRFLRLDRRHPLALGRLQ